MRALRYSLLGLAVLMAIAVSAFLLARNIPSVREQQTEPAEAKISAAKESTPSEGAEEEQKEVRDEVGASPPPSVEPPATTAGEASQPTHLLSLPSDLLSFPTHPDSFPPAGNFSGQPLRPPAAAPAAVTGADDVLPAGSRLSLSSAQEEKLRYVLQSHSILQVEGAEFPLRAGGNVPKEIQLTPLPIELAEIVPHYRHYSYVFAQDRIVIVVTRSREIRLILSM